ncbi:pyrimidine reductase family protein [Cytobacillus oceanisediminis]
MSLPTIDPALYAYPDVDRAWVRVNFVSSVDGSAQGADGVSGMLGTDADRATFDLLRDLCDVVLVSAGTARAEDYGPVDDGVLALVSRSLDVPERLRVPGVLVVAPADVDGQKVDALEAAGVEVLATGDADIDWPAVLDELGRRGLRRVLCEGGPSLLGTLTTLDLVDELCLTLSPVLVAGEGRRISAGDETTDVPLRLAHALDVEGTLLTRWVRDR